MKKIGEIVVGGAIGKFIIYFDEKEPFNKYRLYAEYREYVPDQGCMKRKKLQAKYAHLKSCVDHISGYC